MRSGRYIGVWLYFVRTSPSIHVRKTCLQITPHSEPCHQSFLGEFLYFKLSVLANGARELDESTLPATGCRFMVWRTTACWGVYWQLAQRVLCHGGMLVLIVQRWRQVLISACSCIIPPPPSKQHAPPHLAGYVDPPLQHCNVSFGTSWKFPYICKQPWPSPRIRSKRSPFLLGSIYNSVVRVKVILICSAFQNLYCHDFVTFNSCGSRQPLHFTNPSSESVSLSGEKCKHISNHT